MDINNKKATRQSYGEALLELGKENDKIVVDGNMQTSINTNKISFAVDNSKFEQLMNIPSTIEKSVYSSGKIINYEIVVKPTNTINNVKMQVLSINFFHL